MSKFKEAIRKYRHEVRRVRQIPPCLGLPYRSRKELAAMFLSNVAGVMVIVIPYSMWQRSLALFALVVVTVVVVNSGAWFVWIVWGRDRFPLEKDKHQNAAHDSECIQS